MQESNRISFAQNGRILQIMDVNSEDEGLYTCQITQPALLVTQTTEPISIVVKGMRMPVYINSCYMYV